MDQVTEPNPAQNQDQNLGWRAGLPDSLKNHDSVKDFTKVGDFVQKAIDTKTDLEAQITNFKSKLDNSIPKLPENASAEEINAFQLSLGRPEKPEGYEFVGENLDAGLVSWARQNFFDNGIPAGTAKNLFTKFIEYQNQEIQKFDEAFTAQETKLKTEWGEKYNENIELTRRFLQGASPEFYTALNSIKVGDHLLGNHPELIKIIHKAAVTLKENNSTPGSSTPPGTSAPDHFTYPNSPKPLGQG